MLKQSKKPLSVVDPNGHGTACYRDQLSPSTYKDRVSRLAACMMREINYGNTYN